MEIKDKTTLLQMPPSRIALFTDSIPTAWLEEYVLLHTNKADVNMVDAIAPLMEQVITSQWKMVRTKSRRTTALAYTPQAELHLYQLRHMSFIDYLRKHNHSNLADILSIGSESDEY